MPYLLDTHTLLWFLNDDPKLSNTAKEIIESEASIYVSFVSLWEITIKSNIGKLSLAYTIPEIIQELHNLQIQVIQFTGEDLHTYGSLPFHHRDPFDRLLISQAMNNQFDFITKDELIGLYELNCIW